MNPNRGTRKTSHSKARVLRRFVKSSVIAVLLAISFSSTAAAFKSGNILASTDDGFVREYTPSGTLLTSYSTGMFQTTGSAFDPAGNFYVTGFGADAVTKFDRPGDLVGAFGSGFDADPESITFDSVGNAYVGQADGLGTVMEFDSNGYLIRSLDPAREDRGTDWIALAPDGCTMYYTSEGTSVKRYNVCREEQLADLADGLPGSNAYQIRLLPHNGGMLVADTQYVVRLDDNGDVVQTYEAAGSNVIFAAEVSPDDSTFWAGDIMTGNVIQFSLATGSVVKEFNAGPEIAGLTVVGTSGESGNTTYVALGDSYSSGEGNPGTYITGDTPGSGSNTATDHCHRSSLSYPFDVNLDLGYFSPRFSFHACSGALIRDFYGANHDGNRPGEPAQLSWLNGNLGSHARLVTLTIGGNDAHFAEVLEDCFLNAIGLLPIPCEFLDDPEVRSAIRTMSNNSPTNRESLTQLYMKIAADAPQARVLVLGYPRLFPSSPPLLCGTGQGPTYFNTAQMLWMNEKVHDMDLAIARAVAEARNPRVRYVETFNAFRGHERCTKAPYLNGIVQPLGSEKVNSFHPNILGHRALAALVDRAAA